MHSSGFGTYINIIECIISRLYYTFFTSLPFTVCYRKCRSFDLFAYPFFTVFFFPTILYIPYIYSALPNQPSHSYIHSFFSTAQWNPGKLVPVCRFPFMLMEYHSIRMMLIWTLYLQYQAKPFKTLPIHRENFWIIIALFLEQSFYSIAYFFM